MCEDSLLRFLMLGWHTLEPATPFVHGWAVEAVADHLQAVARGDIRKLLINIPPGCSKSILTNVFYPAWVWGPQDRPATKFISTSFAAELAIRDNLRGRDLIQSEWYQDLWGSRVQIRGDDGGKVKYQNEQTGFRLASSVGKALTGHRGDCIIVDDPHSVRGADSDTVREDALRWFAETLPTRVNDASTATFIVIMQRVHERDVSGFILENDLGYTHLCLPMEYEAERKCVISATGFSDPRVEEGELLWPERFPRQEVEDLKTQFRAWGGSYAEAGQLQQNPIPRGGGLFSREWFQYVDSPTAGGTAVRGWDLASTAKGGDYTVGVLMRRTQQQDLVIEDVVRFQGSAGQVERQILACAEADGRDVKISIPQDPGQAGKAQKSHLAKVLSGYDVSFTPETGSKETRARPLAAQAEAGNLYLVRGPWNLPFVGECAVFPNGKHDDQVDAASRAYATLLGQRTRTAPVGPRLIRLSSSGPGG